MDRNTDAYPINYDIITKEDELWKCQIYELAAQEVMHNIHLKMNYTKQQKKQEQEGYNWS